ESVLLRYSFFFSSRRRHTRFSRDWSSDVCSSDLLSSADVVVLALPVDLPNWMDRWEIKHIKSHRRNTREKFGDIPKRTMFAVQRSEERRVGVKSVCERL